MKRDAGTEGRTVRPVYGGLGRLENAPICVVHAAPNPAVLPDKRWKAGRRSCSIRSRRASTQPLLRLQHTAPPRARERVCERGRESERARGREEAPHTTQHTRARAHTHTHIETDT
eukprot:COSAG02_NODE_5419_length_4346_cov_1.821286_6_plen_116_part_00